MASAEKVRSSSAAPLLAKKYETGQTVFLRPRFQCPLPSQTNQGTELSLTMVRKIGARRRQFGRPNWRPSARPPAQLSRRRGRPPSPAALEYFPGRHNRQAELFGAPDAVEEAPARQREQLEDVPVHPATPAPGAAAPGVSTGSEPTEDMAGWCGSRLDFRCGVCPGGSSGGTHATPGCGIVAICRASHFWPQSTPSQRLFDYRHWR